MAATSNGAQQWQVPPADAQAPPSDVFVLDTQLRSVLKPRPNPWSDGMPYVPDGDVVALRVVHHGRPRTGQWANAGGCRYTNPDGTCSVQEEDSTLSAHVRLLPELPASWAVRAGPRDTVYFDPPAITAAIVTVGGLCPGVNHIIQALVVALASYGVQDIRGIRYGLRGFFETDYPHVPLSVESVDQIHLNGGTVLGTSRGGSNVPRIVDAIQRMKLDQVYIVGGNGGNAAAGASATAAGQAYIDAACARRQRLRRHVTDASHVPPLHRCHPPGV
jgi:6-phosphofructokinase 1